VAGWICEGCGRQFGRRNQSHECVPAMSEAEYFATGAAFERPIFEAVAGHVAGLGPLTIEFLTVGIAFKRVRSFAELRPMRKQVRLSLLLSRVLPAHPRIVKVWRGPSVRSAYFIDLRTPEDVDDDVRDWLTEAYLTSPQ
jgi:Domain of unknown function (DUF5655)